jgi:hypothetical protein
MFEVRRGLAALALCLSASIAQAAPQVWTFQNTTVGGGALTGSFAYDPSTGTFSAWDIDLSALGFGDFLQPTERLTAANATLNPLSSSTRLVLDYAYAFGTVGDVVSGVGWYRGDGTFDITFGAALEVANSPVAIGSGFFVLSAERFGVGGGGGGGAFDDQRFEIAGRVAAPQPPTEVPAPSALLVFLVGLLGLGARLRA